MQKSQHKMLKLSLLFSGCSTATNCIFIGQIQNLLDIPHDLFFFSLFDTLLGFSHFCPLWHRFTTNVTNNRPTNAKILLIILITILPWKVYKEITLLMCLVLVSVLTFSRWKSPKILTIKLAWLISSDFVFTYQLFGAFQEKIDNLL